MKLIVAKGPHFRRAALRLERHAVQQRLGREPGCLRQQVHWMVSASPVLDSEVLASVG